MLTEHAKMSEDNTCLRGKHVVWNAGVKSLTRLTIAVDIVGERVKADSLILNVYINQRTNLANTDTMKERLNEQIAFDSKKVLAAYESSENQARADQMEKLADIYQVTNTFAVTAGGKYMAKFADRQSGI